MTELVVGRSSRRMGLICALVVFAAWSPSALADDLRMICKNDFHEYFVTFDTEARDTLTLNAPNGVVCRSQPQPK